MNRISALLFILLFLVSCSTSGVRHPSSLSNELESCKDLLRPFVIFDAQKFISHRREQGLPVILDIGGEGRYKEAINLNPNDQTSTTGTPGRPISRWLQGKGEEIPLGDQTIDIVHAQNVPVKLKTLLEMLRVIRTPGRISLIHPKDYSDQILARIQKVSINGEIKVRNSAHYQLIEILIEDNP